MEAHVGRGVGYFPSYNIGKILNSLSYSFQTFPQTTFMLDNANTDKTDLQNLVTLNEMQIRNQLLQFKDYMVVHIVNEYIVVKKVDHTFYLSCVIDILMKIKVICITKQTCHHYQPTQISGTIYQLVPNKRDLIIST